MLASLSSVLVLSLLSRSLASANSSLPQLWKNCVNSTQESTPSCSSKPEGALGSEKVAHFGNSSEDSVEFGRWSQSSRSNEDFKRQLWKRGAIQVYIQTPNNETKFELGSSVTIECRFTSSLNQDLKFNLRWLRSVVGSQGSNQSITNTDTDSLTIIAATTRVWTVQRNGGLDLELNEFQAADVGDYTCRSESSDGETLSEAQVKLTLKQRPFLPPLVDDNGKGVPEVAPAEETNQLVNYSQDNLAKLLPSLQVQPEFVELAVGDKIQLVCLTSELDPDPEAHEIEWSFESVLDRKELLREAPIVRQMPDKVSVLGNVIILWSMSASLSGFYRCTYRLREFNLTAEAVGEVALRPAADSAPLVLVSPELVRIGRNGSATIQCEATGYPAPELEWYRLEDSEEKLELDGPHLERTTIPYKDVVAYCERHKCASQVRSVSLLHFRRALGQYQGQWVCRASNKHGSNQASAVVDVEFREPPVVKIDPETREQTIELGKSNNSEPINVTFSCEATGHPAPKLRWLRLGNSNSNNLVGNLDLADLTRVSSATSKVLVERRGKSLMLLISTISLEDEGWYVCLAENSWGRHSQRARLLVRKPISVKILQQSPMLVKPNDSFLLECLASGWPLPTDLEWSRTDRGAFFSLLTRGGDQERAILKFDRVSADDSGEYTCNARSPLNSSLVLKDTIMLLVDNNQSASSTSRAAASQLPQLMVRPARINQLEGANVTIDCLVVSGLQPTEIEWVAPAVSSQSQPRSHSLTQPTIQFGYRSNTQASSGHLLQFGSKLKIVNVSRGHEGIYQCRGKNKIGVENAPALLKVSLDSESPTTNATSATKSKIAKLGSNIELKCQVNGVEEPATSWSRDKLELPPTSLQIESSLWIQNVSRADVGKYICSAKQGNREEGVIQAAINLLVDSNESSKLANLSAKIVASKSAVQVGNSLTLECIVGFNSSTQNQNQNQNQNQDESNLANLEELERNVVWTNLNSGQPLFQDNVYVHRGNLLIIYALKKENSAIYRCNYNDLSQHVDYRLHVLDPNQANETSSADNVSSTAVPARLINSSLIVAENGLQVNIREVPLGAKLSLECPTPESGSSGSFQWTRGNLEQRRQLGIKPTLLLESVQPELADLYSCYQVANSTANLNEPVRTFLVRVLVPVARFAQRPVSFVALPTISGADHQLELELKFLPERDSGLILFNGHTSGDYISLELYQGSIEFRFELGDGTTLLRSGRVELNQWHRLLIERNKRGAVMWLDKQPPVSNSSSGKFFNLNTDRAVLYVGGHQHFMNRSKAAGSGRFSRGFQGCISLLRVSGRELDLMARNRSVSVGVFECADKPECKSSSCNPPNGFCQVDRAMSSERKLDSTSRTSADLDLRCICVPGYTGTQCKEKQLPALEFSQQQAPDSVTPKASLNGACEFLKPCNSSGTYKCQSLSSSSFRCHCKLGAVGESCAQRAEFDSNAVGFSHQSFLHLHLNRPEEAQAYLEEFQKQQMDTSANFNSTNLGRLSSSGEKQEISLKVRTKSSYGLLFYTGQLSASSSTFQSISKSRLSSGVFDYLAIVLVDGHVELSYELGSGLGRTKSSVKINDNLEHRVRVSRSGRLGQLLIDGQHKYETSSPGKLNMLNSEPEIYLGGLPLFQSKSELGNNSLLQDFEGCIWELEINSLGPLNLIRSDSMSQLKEAANVKPCEQTSQPETKQKTYQSPPTQVEEDPDET